MNSIEKDMRERLVPDPGTILMARAVFAYGLGASNGVDQPNHLVFSILLLDGNEDVAYTWTGHEKVTDVGAVFGDRMSAYEAAEALAADHDGYAVVYHENRVIDGKSQWAVFIGHKVRERTA